MNIFINELADFLDSITTRFTLGVNLGRGELKRDVDGVYLQQAPSPEPDMETLVEYHAIDFYAVNKSSDVAKEDMQYIYLLFHRKVHYVLESYDVYLSYATSQPVDLGRDAQGRKVLRISVVFISGNLIS